MFEQAIAAAAAAAPHKVEALPMTPGLTVHIDGDYLAYYAAGKDDTLPGEARLNALGLIEEFRARVGAEHVVVHNTAKGCHKGERYLAATVKPYQEQRKDGRKPKNHTYLQDWLHNYSGDVFRSKLWATREADDGIAACSHFAVGRQPGYVAIATADKDMRMLPGLHINWVSRQVTRVDPGAYEVIGEDGKLYGLKWFWMQMLMGDTTDNCPGLERYSYSPATGGLKYKPVGEKTAAQFLANCRTSDEASNTVQVLYQSGYGTDWADRFVEQAALLWMRCGNDGALDDFATHAGHSRIAHTFKREVPPAVERLKERVRLARQQIDELSNS